MKVNEIIVLTFFTTLFGGCSTCTTKDSIATRTENILQNSFKEIAHYKYGSGYNIVENESKSYVIVLENIAKQSAPVTNTIRFFVYNISENKIVYESKMTLDKIFWESDYEIRVGRIPGMIKKDEESPSIVGGYTINVISGKKVYK